MTNETSITTGGCQCGAVKYKVEGPLREVVNCHCTMCRRLHGNFGPHSKAPKAQITITENKGLAWYDTSETARRGFCQNCGSGLFWDPHDQDAMGIIAGTLDDTNAFGTMGHIFMGEKADFYDVDDDLPKFEGSSKGQFQGDY